MGDVAQVFDRAFGAAAVAHQRGARTHPQEAAVLAAVALLDVDELDLPAPQAIELHSSARRILCVRQLADRLVRELGRIEAEKGAKGVVEAQEPAVAIRIGDADRRLIEGVAVQGLRFAQVAARGDQIREIADRSDVSRNTVGRHDLLGEEAHGARVVGQRAVFEAHRSRPAAKISPGFLDTRPVLRMHALRPVVHTLLCTQLEDLAVFRIDVAQRARRIGVIDGHRGVVEQRQSEHGIAGRRGRRGRQGQRSQQGRRSRQRRMRRLRRAQQLELAHACAKFRLSDALLRE